MKRQRPVPAYKARLAQRAERLEERRQIEADFQARLAFIQWTGDRLEASAAERRAKEAKQAARAKARQPSFFESLAVALGWRRGG